MLYEKILYHACYYSKLAYYYQYLLCFYAGCDTTNVAAISQDSMSVSYYTTVEMIRMIKFPLPLPAQLVAVAMLNDTEQDETIVVTHDLHISVLHFGGLKTIPYPVVNASSLFIAEHLACVTPAANQTTNVTYIVCVDLHKLTWKKCPFPVHPGSFGYSDRQPWPNPPQQLAYVLDEGRSIHKFNVSDGCVNYQIDNPNPGMYKYGQHAWFSYDGSRMFLDNGLTLSTSNLQANGSFDSNSSHEALQYKWFTQFSKANSHEVIGLRSDIPDKVYYYSWPYLNLTRVDTLPTKCPTVQTEGIVESYSIHACDVDLVYAIATFKTKSGEKTGVAYMNMF